MPLYCVGFARSPDPPGRVRASRRHDHRRRGGGRGFERLAPGGDPGRHQRITVGRRTSIQDGSVIHTNHDYPTTVGDECVIGHLVHLECCVVQDGALVGTGAIVLHRSVIESGAWVGAGAVVPNDMIVPSGAMALGVPARIRPRCRGPRRRSWTRWSTTCEKRGALSVPSCGASDRARRDRRVRTRPTPRRPGAHGGPSAARSARSRRDARPSKHAVRRSSNP